MSSGINKVILIGNIGQNPEVKESSGGQIVNISLATSESYKDKASVRQERTEWHRVVFFGKLADIAAQYLKKGAKIYVEGKLQTVKWKNKAGEDRTTTSVVANVMQMLGAHAAEVNAPQKDDSAEFNDEIPF